MCSVRAHLKVSWRVSALCQTDTGATHARTGKYCFGIGCKHPVIVCKTKFRATSTCFICFDFRPILGAAVRCGLLVLNVLTELCTAAVHRFITLNVIPTALCQIPMQLISHVPRRSQHSSYCCSCPQLNINENGNYVHILKLVVLILL